MKLGAEPELPEGLLVYFNKIEKLILKKELMNFKQNSTCDVKKSLKNYHSQESLYL